MKNVIIFLFLLIPFLGFSQTPLYELEYAPDEGYLIMSKDQPNGEYDTLSLNRLVTILQDSLSVGNDVFLDTAYFSLDTLFFEMTNDKVFKISTIGFKDGVISSAQLKNKLLSIKYTLGNVEFSFPNIDFTGYMEHSDTSAMLAPYLTNVDLLDNDPNNEIQDLSGLVQYTDTSSMLAPYLTKAERLWSENSNDIYYNAGKVGVGTSTPEEAFHVYDGALYIQDPDNQTARIRFKNNSNEWIFNNNAIGRFNFQPVVVDNIFSVKNMANADLFSINTANGNTTFSTLSGSGDGLVQTTNNGLISTLDYSSWDLNDFWTKNGTDLYYSGDVGINTTSPEEALHVIGDVLIERNGTSPSLITFGNVNNEWLMSNNGVGNYIMQPQIIDADYAIRSLNGDFYFKLAANGNVSFSDLSGNGVGIVQVSNGGGFSHLDYSTWDLDASDDFSGDYNDLSNLPTLADLNYWTRTSGDLFYEGDAGLTSSSNFYTKFSYENTSNKWLTGVLGNGDFVAEPQTINSNFVIRSLDNDEWFKVNNERKKLSLDNDDLGAEANGGFIAVLQEDPTDASRKELVQLEANDDNLILVSQLDGTVEFEKRITPATFYRDGNITVASGTTYSLTSVIENVDHYDMIDFTGSTIETNVQGNFIITLSFSSEPQNIAMTADATVGLYNVSLSSYVGELREVTVSDITQSTFQFYAFLAAAYDYEIRIANEVGATTGLRILNTQATFQNID